MITVMKASAGSGKTFKLAEKYIKMLLVSADPKEYRHILAVTFTNKATDEMKSRIIKELYKIAAGKTSDMNVPKDAAKAKKILSDILHDYSSFSVSTIDKFFQQTLRAFARELGQFNRYQVELDKNALVDEAVDTILDELNADNDEDRKMIDFIVESMEDRLSEGNGLDVDGGLKKMARQLKSESFNKKCKEIGLDRNTAYTPEELSSLKKKCQKICKAFEKVVHQKAEKIIADSYGAGFPVEAYSRGWLKSMEPFKTWKNNADSPSESLMGKLSDPSAEKWFNKDSRYKFNAAEAAIGSQCQDFAALWSSPEYKTYRTASMLLEQIYGLGVAARLFKAFDRIAKEKNVVCLDESNSLLRDIIDGSDAPFVYEKTGVRFRNFLLDEFQDTSTTQWDNFLPLLNESQSKKLPPQQDPGHVFDDLIVGDVKQSIYRWRESDWGLLDHVVEESFPGEIFNDPLGCNFRSLDGIREFNNAIYPKLAEAIDRQNPVPKGMHSLSEIYAGCFQKAGKGEKQKGGAVEVKFVQSEKEELKLVLDTITALRDEHNARYGEIAVLVRTKRTGTDIAQHLIDNGIPVVTDASLLIKNSISVRRLVSMMAYVNNPEDMVGPYVANLYGIDKVPDSFHSLPDLAETLYRVLCESDNGKYLGDCQKEVMYISSFMDFVADYANTNGNNLGDFLAYWEEKDPSVNASEGSNAVRIITIHKSKGLDFPYVIVPFLEKITLYSDTKTTAWASPEQVDGALAEVPQKLYHIRLSDKSTSQTHFRDSYEWEKFNQGVDVLNLLYVATTRARLGMSLIANTKYRDFSKSMGQLIYALCEGNALEGALGKATGKALGVPSGKSVENDAVQSFVWGEVPGFDGYRKNGEDEDEAPPEPLELTFPYYNIGERLQIRPYAADFFLQVDNALENLSYRQRGVVLHDILSRVERPGDVEKAVEAAIADGSVSSLSKDKLCAMMKKFISKRPEFFPEDPNVEVLNEQSYICPGYSQQSNESLRPDRVLIYPDGRVVIVDYKFAHMREEYLTQIQDYKNIFLAMGYTDIEAYLWFVYQNKIV